MHHIDFEDESDLRAKGINRLQGKNLFKLLMPHRKKLFLCGVLLISSSGLSLTGPLLIRRAIDVNFAGKNFNGLLVTVILYALVILSSFVIGYFQRIQLEILGQKVIKKLRVDLFSHLVHLSQKFFDKNTVGILLSRIESDTEAIRELFTFTVVTLIADVFMLLGMFAIMFYACWQLTSIVFVMMPFLFIGILIFNKKGAPRFLAVRKRMADIYSFLNEYLQGYSVVQAYSQEKNVCDSLNMINKQKAVVEFRAEKLVIFFFQSIFLYNTISIVLVLWFGSAWSQSLGITIGTLVMFLSYLQRFFEPIFSFSEQINIIQRAFAGAERVFNLLGTVSEVRNADDLLPWKKMEKSIEFKNVSFSYNTEPVLENVSFIIPKGERWAIVGPTGGGKTSIINLLLRFYDPQQGAIFVDELDIKKLSLKELRAKMSLVMQDIYLFPMTVLDNLRMEDKKIPEEKVVEALKMVHAYEIVQKLPSGLNTELSERGLNLSLGERQLLSFARALVFDPEILILDEATSSVDPLTEKKIQNAMKVLLHGRTSLIIAHRLQTILDCSGILVVSQGRIAEKGTHRELLAKKGIYHMLYQLQFEDRGVDFRQKRIFQHER